MEELHIDNINRGHEASYGLGHVLKRGRTPTKLITDILNISFDFEWTEFLVIKLVIRPCYLNISS
jgi:hypothetical protein